MLSPQFSGRKNVTGRKWLQVRSSFGRGRPISCRFKVEEWTQEKRPSLFVLPLVRSAVPSSLKGHVRDSVASRLQLRSHHHCRRLCSPSAPQKSALLVRPAPTATSCSSFESFSGLADCTECQKKKEPHNRPAPATRRLQVNLHATELSVVRPHVTRALGYRISSALSLQPFLVNVNVAHG